MLTPRERSILKMLNFARLYVAKASAEGLMNDCVTPPASALRKINEFIENLDDGAEKGWRPLR